MSVVDGLVSGLNTTSIINAIMAVERAPVTRLQAKQSDGDKKTQAFSDIQSSLATLRTAALALARPSTFSTVTATSSNADLATATPHPGASATSATFKVLQLATSYSSMTHANIGDGTQLIGAGRVAVGVGLASLGVTAMTVSGAAAAAANDISITAAGGSQVKISVGADSVTVDKSVASVTVGGLSLSVGADGLVEGPGKVQIVATDESSTIADLASSFTAVRAQVLSLGTSASPDRRLVFTSPTTGEASKFLVATADLNTKTSAALGTLDVVGNAKNSQVQIGDGTIVERSSNLLTDVFSGIDVQLVKADPATSVTVNAKADQSGMVDKVKQWINAMNASVSVIDSKSAYDPSTKIGGVLLGDSTTRTIRQQLVSSMSSTATSGSGLNLSQIGVSVDAKGRYTLDETMFNTALSTDAASVTKLFARAASTTNPGVTYSGAADTAVPGTYDIVIVKPPARATSMSDPFADLDGEETLTFTAGGKQVVVAVLNGQSRNAVIESLNAAFKSKGVGLTADEDSGSVRVRTNNYGSKATFSVKSSRVGAGSTGLGGSVADTDAAYSGDDVEGTIDGVDALGSGATLTATSGNANGLKVQISASTIGDAGQITYTGGTAGALLRALGGTGGADSNLSTASASLTSARRDLDDRITAYQDRLTQTEARIRRQFTAMEQALSQLRAQGSQLSSILNSVSGTNTSSTNGQ